MNAFFEKYRREKLVYKSFPFPGDYFQCVDDTDNPSYLFVFFSKKTVK